MNRLVCPSKLQPAQPPNCLVLHLSGKLQRQFSFHFSALSNSATASVEGVCMCEHVQKGAVKTKGISQQKPREGPYKCHRDVFKRSWGNNTACSKHSSAIHLLHYQHAPFKCSGPCWDLHPLCQCLYIKGKLADIEFQMSPWQLLRHCRESRDSAALLQRPSPRALLIKRCWGGTIIKPSLFANCTRQI